MILNNNKKIKAVKEEMKSTHDAELAAMKAHHKDELRHLIISHEEKVVIMTTELRQMKR